MNPLHSTIGENAIFSSKRRRYYKSVAFCPDYGVLMGILQVDTKRSTVKAMLDVKHNEDYREEQGLTVASIST